MTTKKKIIIAISCVLAVAAIVAASVTTTIALLHSTAVVHNTFTIGQVYIELFESKVDDNGKKITGEGAGETDKNTYKLVPGTTYDKDPTIRIKDGSSSSYLFVHVKNDLKSIATTDPTLKTIAQQMAEYGWARYKEGSTGWIYVYCGAGNVPAIDSTNTQGWTWTEKSNGENAAAYANCTPLTVSGGTIPIFTNFTIDEGVDEETLKGFNTAELIVRAIAIQSSSFQDVDEAWEKVHEIYPFILVPSSNNEQ